MCGETEYYGWVVWPAKGESNIAGKKEHCYPAMPLRGNCAETEPLWVLHFECTDAESRNLSPFLPHVTQTF